MGSREFDFAGLLPLRPSQPGRVPSLHALVLLGSSLWPSSSPLVSSALGDGGGLVFIRSMDSRLRVTGEKAEHMDPSAGM